MYWQVYLHKTSVACEKMLISTLLRAKELAAQDIELFASPALRFFLYQTIDRSEFLTNPECLNYFIQLDDNDIWTALKVWSNHDDIVLASLSRGLIDRKLFKVAITKSPITALEKEKMLKRIAEELNISKQEAKYFLSVSTIENNMYRKEDDSIEIIYSDGTTKDIAEASDMLNISLLSRKVKKYYVCFHRFSGYKG